MHRSTRTVRNNPAILDRLMAGRVLKRASRRPVRELRNVVRPLGLRWCALRRDDLDAVANLAARIRVDGALDSPLAVVYEQPRIPRLPRRVVVHAPRRQVKRLALPTRLIREHAGDAVAGAGPKLPLIPARDSNLVGQRFDLAR